MWSVHRYILCRKHKGVLHHLLVVNLTKMCQFLNWSQNLSDAVVTGKVNFYNCIVRTPQLYGEDQPGVVSTPGL